MPHIFFLWKAKLDFIAQKLAYVFLKFVYKIKTENNFLGLKENFQKKKSPNQGEISFLIFLILGFISLSLLPNRGHFVKIQSQDFEEEEDTDIRGSSPSDYIHGRRWWRAFTMKNIWIVQPDYPPYFSTKVYIPNISNSQTYILCRNRGSLKASPTICLQEKWWKCQNCLSSSSLGELHERK